MAIVVQKYGGAVLADAAKMRKAADLILRSKKKGNSCVVVVSAPGDMTDDLIQKAKQVSDNPDKREMDMLLSTGEQQSCALLAMHLKSRGHDAVSYTGYQLDIVTDSRHTKAKILSMNVKKVQESLRKGKIVIVAGFQGRTEAEDITTLGRGGSDLTAVALAAALKAKVCEFYKDVRGIFTANPHLVAGAKKIDRITYEEMLELASLGAQVLNARSVEYAKNYNVPLFICSTDSSDGTHVVKEAKSMEKVVVSGVTYNMDEAKITIQAVPDKPGTAAMVFNKIAQNDINVDMIVQNVSTSGRTDLSFTVSKEDVRTAKQVTEKIVRNIKAGGVTVDENIAKVSVVGVGMRSHTGVAAQMFEALAKAKINIAMISTSEIKISCVVARAQAKKAVQVIHNKFKLGKK